MSNDWLIAIAAAFIINLLNTSAAVLLIKKAKEKEWKSFTKLIFGGMMIRMAFVLALVWYCIDFLELNALVFGISLAIIFFLLLLGEIIYLNYRTNLVNLQDNKTNKGEIDG